MKKIIIFFTLIISNLISEPVIYKQGCIVPNILLETIKLTENETSYPYLIRTNDTTTLNKFYTIAEKFKFNMTKDSMLIDCINHQSCIDITNALIKNQITNLDLGLFQINYENYPYAPADLFGHSAGSIRTV